jgi:hypothetical protein
MECLSNADGLVNLKAMVGQLAAKGLLEDKSIPIVLGRFLQFQNLHSTDTNTKFLGFLDGGLHYSVLSIIGAALSACLKCSWMKDTP